MAGTGLIHGPLGRECVHICVDMQRLFAEETEWFAPWMPRVAPNVWRIADRHAASTVFTRFIPAQRAGQGHGAWRRYYERWAGMTVEALGPAMLELTTELQMLAPPAEIIDKHVYSPWLETDLHGRLARRGTTALVVTGGETDVCVLATVLGAIDFGYRVVIVTDALCSSSDETHEALLALYRSRFSQQIETASTEEVLDGWLAP